MRWQGSKRKGLMFITVCATRAHACRLSQRESLQLLSSHLPRAIRARACTIRHDDMQCARGWGLLTDARAQPQMHRPCSLSS